MLDHRELPSSGLPAVPYKRNRHARILQADADLGATLAGSSCLIAKNRQELLIIKERNPEWYESLSSHNVDSLVIFPLKFNGQLLGYIWVTNFEVENAVKIKEVLELTTFFIGSEIANYQMLKRLEVLSTIDILTGTLNRNAMNNRVDGFDAEAEKIKTLGIIFADLNGLKMVNDSSGHSEGDRFLKRTAAKLRQIFVDDEIYRAGGDEFLILAPDNTREEFEEKVRELEEAQAKVNFAMGTCFQEGDIDIRAALRSADENMYSSKEEYYLKHPELKYR
ncbi:MAG: diguanylate cyclase [Lachnospiraceae bacterium]|nr:diguanylate cyclase [Lachnospiraceae bacterium]